jgi:hypothetical protein
MDVETNESAGKTPSQYCIKLMFLCYNTSTRHCKEKQISNKSVQIQKTVHDDHKMSSLE